MVNEIPLCSHGFPPNECPVNGCGHMIPLPPEQDVFSALRSIVQFAYENGYHELGYDPVQVLEDALSSKEVKR